MDNFLEEDIATFVYKKSLEILEKLNNIHFNQDEIEIKKSNLSGISNTIFKVEIRYKMNFLPIDAQHNPPKQGNQESNETIRINHLFFKVFGRISVLVDRDLETFLMTKLSEKGFGPRIYDTDSKTYRVEEYFDGFKVLHSSRMLEPKILYKMIENFSNFNILGGEIDYYAELIGNKTKSEYFGILRDVDKYTNIINFLLKKMKPLALDSFRLFQNKFTNYNIDQNDTQILNWDHKIKHVEYTLNNLDKLLYEILPERGIIVIGHNDSHPLNILINSDCSKVVLCDYEYSAYNFLGFDIANYLIETCYYLSAENFPFYDLYRDNLQILENDEGYRHFLDFFEIFEKRNAEHFKSYELFPYIINECKSREYFYRMMGISSLLWFTFAVIYYDFDSIKNQTGYDYLNYSLDRLMIYDEIVKRKVNCSLRYDSNGDSNI